MKKSLELKQAREKLSNELDAWLDAIGKSESGRMDAEQKTEYEAKKKSIADLDEHIEEAEDIENTKAAIASRKMPLAPVSHKLGRGQEDEQKKMGDRFHFCKAMRESIKGGVTGVELEMTQEAQKEAKEFGGDVSGDFAVPSFFVDTKGVDATVTANQGESFVATDLSGRVIESLMPELLSESFGATKMTGMVGNYEIPKETNNPQAGWGNELDDVPQADPTDTTIPMTPHKLGAFTEYSRQWMNQTSISADNYIRRKIKNAARISLDLAYFNGSGVGPQPLGLFNVPGINTIEAGANGGALTHPLVVAMETACATENALAGNLGYIVTPKVRGLAKTTKKDSGSGLFLWDNATPGAPLNNYRVGITTQLPRNLSKGSGSDLHGIVFADFSKTIISQWGGMDFIVNPYSKDKSGVIRLTVHSFWDFAFEHAEAISVIKDLNVNPS